MTMPTGFSGDIPPDYRPEDQAAEAACEALAGKLDELGVVLADHKYDALALWYLDRLEKAYNAGMCDGERPFSYE
jgi:hypothetical protein